jgi:hypothetical protein
VKSIGGALGLGAPHDERVTGADLGIRAPVVPCPASSTYAGGPRRPSDFIRQFLFSHRSSHSRESLSLYVDAGKVPDHNRVSERIRIFQSLAFLNMFLVLAPCESPMTFLDCKH